MPSIKLRADVLSVRSYLAMTCLAMVAALLSGCATTTQAPERGVCVAGLDGYRPLGPTTYGGTAFFVEDAQTLVTAWHVAIALNDMWINMGAEGMVQVESVLADDELNDLILVRLAKPVPNARPLTVCTRIPSAEESLRVLSVDLNGRVQEKPVRFQQFGDIEYPIAFQMEGALKGGDSGSPCLDALNRVVGVAVGARGSRCDVVQGVALRDLLTNARRTNTPSTFNDWRLRIGVPLWSQVADAAHSAYSKDDFANALPAYLQVVRFRSSNSRDINYISGCLHQLKYESESFIEWFRNSGLDWKTSWRLSMTLGTEMYLHRKYPEAADYFRNAAALFPSPITCCHLALALYRMGQLHESAQILEASAQAWPAYLHTFNYLRLVGEKLHDDPMVRRANDGILALTPTDGQSLLSVADSQLHSHDAAGLEQTKARLRALGAQWANRVKFLYAEPPGR